MRLITAAALLIVATPAFAKDVTLTITDDDQKNWTAIAPVFDQCVAGSSLRGDASACRNIAAFLNSFSGRIAAEAAKPESKPADTPSTTPKP